MRDNNAEIRSLREQAQERLACNDLASARDLYNRICALDGTDAESWFILGAIHGSLGGFDESIACCRKALALRPDHAGTHYNLAQAYLHLHKFDEAAVHLRNAVRLKPDYADAWNNLGIVLHDLRRTDEAAVCYREALKLRPDLAGTRFLLAAVGGLPMPDKPPPQYVAKLFDAYADQFEQQLVGQLQYQIPQLLSRFVRRVIGPQPCSLATLDLGCGTGLCGPLFRDIAQTLTGVDLSAGMVEKARVKNVYDQLLVGDITFPGLIPRDTFDLILATDVFPYLGDLQPVFRACAEALKSGAHFAFSVEAADTNEPYILRSTDRYAHTPAYIRKLTADTGFVELGMDKVVVRMDRGKPVDGCIFILRRSV